MRVQQHLPLIAGEALVTYVHRTARTVLVDARRRSQRRRTERLDIEDNVVAPDAADEDTHAIAASWLPAFLEQLPAPMRETLRLSELEQMPHREIAQRLGLSVSAVKSRVQRGRAKLRSALLACCAFDLDRRGRVIGWRRHKRCGC